MLILDADALAKLLYIAGNPALIPGTNYKPKTDLATSVTLQYNLF